MKSEKGKPIEKLSDPQIDLAWRLLEASCARRYNYADRAGVILAADALVAGSVVFLVGEISAFGIVLRLALGGLSLLAFVALTGSLLLSMLAILDLSWIKRTRQAIEIPNDLPPRIFISPPDTFGEIGNLEIAAFIQRLQRLDPTELFAVLSAELFVDLKVQLHRYRRLQLSATLLVSASILVAVIACVCVLKRLF